MKSEEIIKQIRENRLAKVYKHLYKSYPSIKKWIVINNGTTQDAEDIFQEALVVFCINCRKEDFTLTAELSTYLTAIAKNTWYKTLRKRGVEVTFEMEPAMEVEVSYNEDNYNLAEQAFELLGKKCQELLGQFYVLKLSFKEICKRLDFSNEKVAKNQKYRCLNKAKDLYKSLVQEGGELC